MAEARARVLAVFREVGGLLDAVADLKASGFSDLETYSPVPVPAIEKALGRRPSPVRVFTLVGGLTGLTAGWVLTIGSALHYPLIVGGKPIVSLPPFLIVAYILTILFGALATIGGMLIFSRLPSPRRDPGYDPRFSGEHYGLAVSCSPEQIERVREILGQANPVETRTVT